MRKRRWRTCIFFISQILLAQARILDPSFFEINHESIVSEDEVINEDEEAHLNDEKSNEVLDDLDFIQSFLTSITTPPPNKFSNTKTTESSSSWLSKHSTQH